MHNNEAESQKIRHVHKQWNGLVYSLLIISTISLILAFLAPLFSVNKLWIFADTITLASSIVSLFTSGNYLLGLIVGLFAVVFPIVKLGSLYWLWTFSTVKTVKQNLSWLAAISKWAMLDVFVIALMVVAIKLGAVMEVELHFGLFFFIAAVILSKVTVRMIDRILTPST